MVNGFLSIEIILQKQKNNDVNEQNGNAVNYYQKSDFEVHWRTEKGGQGKDYPLLKIKLKKG
jgi:hypothetical protein